MASSNTIFTEADVLEAASSNLPASISTTGEAVINAVAELKPGGLSPSIDLRNSNIELPTPKEEKGDVVSKSLGKIDKFLDSMNDFLISSKNPINKIFKQGKTNQNSQSTSTSNTNDNRNYKIFNSVFATTNNEMATPEVDKIKEVFNNRETNSILDKTSKESLFSILDKTSKESLFDRVLDKSASSLFTKTSVLEKEIDRLNTQTTVEQPPVQVGTTGTLETAARLDDIKKPASEPALADSSLLSIDASDISAFFGIGSDSDSTQSTQIKSKTLVDSKTVNKMLTPDKTVERTVAKLSKDLPAAVNNLSTSVTSLNNTPQSSVTNVNNAGTRIDQSTNINNQNQPTRPQTDMGQPENKSTESQLMNQNEFYLQAIYSALMSGKVKVKIEHI